MIVVCPSCQQRYRHPFDAASTATAARCSGCDERFPLARPKATYRVLAPQLATAPAVDDPRRVAQPALAADPAGQAATQASGNGFAVEMPIAEPVAVQTVVNPAEEAEPPVVSHRRSILESLVAVVPTGLGLVLAYHLAARLGRDPITGAALGGALGLLLGWACLLWITRRD